MKCPKCGGSMKCMVNVTMCIPEDVVSNITKKNIRRKDVELWGANWEAADHICVSCRYVFNGLKTYIQKLEKKIKDLEELNFQLKNKL